MNFLKIVSNIKATVPIPGNLPKSEVKDIVTKIYGYSNQFETMAHCSNGLNSVLKAEGISERSAVTHIHGTLQSLTRAHQKAVQQLNSLIQTDPEMKQYFQQ